MKATISHSNRSYTVDLSRPLDISIPLRASEDNVRAWHVGPPRMEPVKVGDWTGAVSAGAPVNFRNVFFNPHGHGTHTECLGHITPEIDSVNAAVKHYFFPASLVSVTPEAKADDRVITKEQLESAWKPGFAEALVIRTLPNPLSKCTMHYSNTNPPFLHAGAAAWMRDAGIRHLLVDIPSVDKERDDGALAAHHAFWNVPDRPRGDCTITELIYVPDAVPDGDYFLDLHFAPFENDASPSRPVLFALEG